VYIGVLKFW